MFYQFRQRVALAGLLTAVSMTLLAGPVAAQSQLTGEQIQAALSGQAFEARNGMMRASMTYQTDGSLQIRAMMRTLNGRWWVENDSLCVDMPEGPRAGQGCGLVTAQGDGTYVLANGMRLTPQ